VSAFVLDASLAMAWCFESEATPYTEAILAQIGQGEKAWVPALWRLEVVNALLKAKRQGRVTIERAEKFLIQLREFAIESDDQSLAKADTELFQLGLKHQLSSYDAAYLELAMRRKLPLATQDNNLIIAAKVKAVALFQP
jgi:predicted nucleic acid-binding protein